MGKATSTLNEPSALRAYVLERFRGESGQPLPGAPVFWYRPLSMTEQLKILASKNIERQRLASPDAELRAIGHQLLLAHEAFALLHNLVRCDGAGVELPPPARQGRNTWNGATVERRRALDNLPREWRMELAAAIIENRVTPLAAAKAADEA